MINKRNIFHHPLFGAVSGLLVVILGFMFQFYYQRNVAIRDALINDVQKLKYDIIDLKQQIKTFRLIDSMDYNETDKRLLKIERKVKL